MNKPDNFFGPLLPRSSSQESLETISSNKLSELFDPEFFEIRDELHRDKGIDLTVEVKENGFYTNFRFAVQLKSSNASKKNRDGSVSFGVEVSNINYLQNSSMQSYYFFYDHISKQFYYEQSTQVYQNLLKKYKSGKFPNTFLIRFNKLLDKSAIDEIYSRTKNNGHILRNIQFHLDTSESDSKGIVIDTNRAVYSVEQNIAFLSKHGLELINRAEFDAIIEIEQRTSQHLSLPVIFNLVCGVAYFYKGRVHRAIDYLRQAERHQDELEPQIRYMFQYTLLLAKYQSGMLDKKSYKSELEYLIQKEDLGSFLKIEREFKALQKNNQSETQLVDFYEKINQIIAEEPENLKTRAYGYTRILEAEAKLLLHDLCLNLSMATFTRNQTLLDEINNQWDLIEVQFYNRADKLIEFISPSNDINAMGIVSRLRIEWQYQYSYIKQFYSTWNFVELNYDPVVDEKTKKSFDKRLQFLDACVNLYQARNDNENIIHSLILKYEILCFVGELAQAIEVKNSIQVKIDAQDLESLRMNFESISHNGTSYDRFLNEAMPRLINIYEVAKNGEFDEFLKRPFDYHPVDVSDRIIWSAKELSVFEFPIDNK